MMPDRSDHHPFCSGCNLSPGCTDWTLCAREFFPNLHPAENICPKCQPGPCTNLLSVTHDG